MKVSTAAVLLFAVALGAPQLSAQDLLTVRSVVDTGTTTEGLQAGSDAARERSVAGRAMLGFMGGLPIGFLGLLLPQGDPAGPIGVGSGLAIIGAAWRLGDTGPPHTQSFRERGETYMGAYLEGYKTRLLERRKKATLLGALAGTVTGFGFLIVLLFGLDS